MADRKDYWPLLGMWVAMQRPLVTDEEKMEADARGIDVEKATKQDEGRVVSVVQNRNTGMASVEIWLLDKLGNVSKMEITTQDEHLWEIAAWPDKEARWLLQ